MNVDMSAVIDSLTNLDYTYDSYEDVYQRPVSDGSVDEVTLYEREGVVTVIRYNRNGVQTSFKDAVMNSSTDLKKVLSII